MHKHRRIIVSILGAYSTSSPAHFQVFDVAHSKTGNGPGDEAKSVSKMLALFSNAYAYLSLKHWEWAWGRGYFSACNIEKLEWAWGRGYTDWHYLRILGHYL